MESNVSGLLLASLRLDNIPSQGSDRTGHTSSNYLSEFAEYGQNESRFLEEPVHVWCAAYRTLKQAHSCKTILP